MPTARREKRNVWVPHCIAAEFPVESKRDRPNKQSWKRVCERSWNGSEDWNVK